ncbi:hypothetical protein H9Q70_000119 [Fusarium xylarioides]|nr:hypothetical protein H9Q70_000119 [Fusarium xylarioides]
MRFWPILDASFMSIKTQRHAIQPSASAKLPSSQFSNAPYTQAQKQSQSQRLFLPQHNHVSSHQLFAQT